MKLLHEIIGYVLGGVLFVGLIPTLMWLASGMPDLLPVNVARGGVATVLMLAGLALSICTIIYMKRRGKGNPMDAFGHEVAPRTSHLMTDGPYRLNRNPMLTGTFVYLIGALVWLRHWQALLVFAVFVAIMMVQVFSEERRLRRDFGKEYEDFCKIRRRF